MRPAALSQATKVLKQLTNGEIVDLLPLFYCNPFAFSGFDGAFEGAIEWLFTPGRGTMTWEGGIVRRIYTDGRLPPGDPDETNRGSSVGPWEGQTLVVDTMGLNSAAAPIGIRGFLPHGRKARVTEHIFLKSQDELEFDTALVAPDLLTRPVKTSLL